MVSTPTDLLQVTAPPLSEATLLVTDTRLRTRSPQLSMAPPLRARFSAMTLSVTVSGEPDAMARPPSDDFPNWRVTLGMVMGAPTLNRRSAAAAWVAPP